MKIPSMTFWTNLVCAIAAVGSQILADPAIMGLLSPRVAHVITGVAMAAMWYRSHRNIFVNPDGSTPVVVKPAVVTSVSVPVKKGK